MIPTYPLTEAEQKLTAIVRELEQQPLILLTQHGKAVAILLSIQEYERITAHKQGFWQAYEEFRCETALTNLKIDPSLFSERDSSLGREAE